jgi:hypothetical protein
MRRFFQLLALGVSLAIIPISVAAQPLDDQVKSLIDQAKKKANLKFDPTTPQAGIDATAYELQRLSKPSLAVSITQNGANTIAAEQLKKEGSKFSNLRFSFAGQAASATVDFTGNLTVTGLGVVDTGAQLRAQLTPAIELTTDQPVAEFRIRFAVTALDVSSLKLSRNGQPLPSFANGLAEELISGLLVPAQALLNRMELRVPTLIAAKIDIQPGKKEGVAIEFDPKSIAPKLQIVAATSLLDQGRLTIMAQDESPPANVTVKPHNISFDVFRGEFSKKLNGMGASWINQGELAAYVETGIIERLTTKLLATGPVCMQAKLVDLPVPVHQKLSLPPESSIDCTPTRDCTPTKDCSQTEDCAQRASCGEVCTFRAPITGHCVTHGHDLGCEAGKVARKAKCETEKERRRVQCEADKVVNKAACEALKTSEKDSCEALKQAYKSLRGTGPNYANVDSDDLRLGGGARVCLNDIKLEGKTLRLTGKLQIEGAATGSGKITFTPLNVVGHTMCFAPFSYQLSDTVKVTPQPIEIDTSARLETETGSISINALISNPIHMKFPFRAIAEKLATDPKFQIICPIPGVATKLRVLTPDRWWPKVARDDVDKDFPSFSFNLDLFTKPVQVGGIALMGRLRHTERAIGGVFTVANDRRSR